MPAAQRFISLGTALCIIVTSLSAPAARASDDPVMSPDRVVGRIALNSLANIGGGLTGAAVGAVLGSPGGVFGAAIVATGGLGVGILFVAPAYMEAVCHAQGCDGQYAAGMLGGLGVSLLFVAIEMGIDGRGEGEESRIIAYAILGPILQAAIYELSVRPMGRGKVTEHSSTPAWSVSPFVSLAPENRSFGLALSAEFR